MSRSGYCDADYGDQETILAQGRWAGMVASALRGNRGQAFLKTALEALEKMETKRLAEDTFKTNEGEMCFFAAVADARGISLPLEDLNESAEAEDDEYIADVLADAFNIAPCMVRELLYYNDEFMSNPEERYEFMKNLISKKVKTDEHSN